MILGRGSLGLSLSLLCTASLFGCTKKHITVHSVPELGYPGCGESTLPTGLITASGDLRSGPTSLEPDIVERFDLTRRGCLLVGASRQEWSHGISDTEVVWDEHSRPLRVWKRMTLPHATRPDGFADIRRYELRTPEVTIKRRNPDGSMVFEILRGAHPTTVIAPGRGLLTVWIQRARLSPGQSLRELALDVRETVEVIRPVTLRRGPDLYQPWLGRRVRVYTVYGRETVFTDDTNVVIGDLAGLRPSLFAGTPAPAPLPMYGRPDPVNTP